MAHSGIPGEANSICQSHTINLKGGGGKHPLDLCVSTFGVTLAGVDLYYMPSSILIHTGLYKA